MKGDASTRGGAKAAAAKKPFEGIPIDWGSIAPLRLRARAIAEGLYAGEHRSARRGPGVEFFGQRPYVPGDDLRFFDKRSLLRHGKLMIREFETETDRSLWIVVDATTSMTFRGSGPGAKLAYAALIAAAMARVAVATGDPVGLGFIGGENARLVPARAGGEAFERVVGALEALRGGGDLANDPRALDRAIGPVAERARRGSTIVFLSDLIDLPPQAEAAIGALATRGRTVVVGQILDPDEETLPYEGHSRFRSLEGGAVVEADPATIRPYYEERLAKHRAMWSTDLRRRGGDLVRATSSLPPGEVIRALLGSISGGSAFARRET